MIVEPVFYWPEHRFPVHEAAIEPAHLARLPTLEANPAATACVSWVRAEVIAIFERFGCAHYQIGRTYPYMASRDAASRTLLQAVKGTVDPAGIFNPGSLGLATPRRPAPDRSGDPADAVCAELPGGDRTRRPAAARAGSG